MPTIKELLENLGVEDSTLAKTASAASSSYSDKEIEKAVKELGLVSTGKDSTIKVASQPNGGKHMELHDLYESYFGGNEKTASVKKTQMQKNAGADLEKAGEKAGAAFSQGLNDRLFKFAMDQEMESAASEARDGSSETAVPGVSAASPQLPQNKPEDAAAGYPMDTTPSEDIMNNGPLLDKAIEKATILAALESNDTDDVEGVSMVDLGLEMPSSQAEA